MNVLSCLSLFFWNTPSHFPTHTHCAYVHSTKAELYIGLTHFPFQITGREREGERERERERQKGCVELSLYQSITSF
jgi:hypothetical protein